ncbi:MAG TPA: hypothetical protein IAA69_09230 [Candidatus Aveggerthella stercoripullorum]|uniref:Uncharacterized protein n=1 Tax=Candidatus Aveggerthella stercoripullorum TaxID=2840688 RepID=A0A9D1A2I1_9ACTN|nr:hypothetical protein [Candidatus Aveggerthella stercoripullorum]
MNAWEIIALWGWLVDLEGCGVDMDELLGLHWDSLISLTSRTAHTAK